MGDETARARGSRRISFSAASPDVVVTRADSADTTRMDPELAFAAVQAYTSAPGSEEGKVPIGELEGLLKGLQLSGGVSDFMQRQKVIEKSQSTVSKEEFVAVVGALEEFVKEVGDGAGSSENGPPGSSVIAPSLYGKLEVRS